MRAEQPNLEVIGTIVGMEAGCIVVQTDDGNRLLCRGVKRLHRVQGFHSVPVGRRARVRLRPVRQDKTPLLVEVLRA